MDKVKLRDVAITIVFMGFILSFFLFGAYKMINSEFYMNQLEIDFCEEQGFGFKSEYNEQSETIWCGMMVVKEGKRSFDGITYRVDKGKLGFGFNVKEDFDVNEYLEQKNKLNDGLGEKDDGE